MHQANPLWGAPRIHGELLKLGIAVAQSTVARYLPRPRKPPSQTWRTFLTSHLAQTAAIDFFMTRDVGMEEVLTAPRSPWQNPFAERLVAKCLPKMVSRSRST